MFRMKIIYRLILVFLVFAVMIIVPLTFSFLKQVNVMISEEESVMQTESDEYVKLHKEFISRLVDQTLPYAFYILIMSFFLAIFLSRKMLISLKQLEKGSHALRDGDLEIRLDIISNDEIGEATRAFNEMAASLRQKTAELQKKDIYINAMLDPIWVVDMDNIVVDINPAFTRLLGYAKEEAVGDAIYDFFDEKNAAIMRKQIEGKRDKGQSSVYEIQILSREGQPIPVLISGSPIMSGDRVVGRIGILKDFREQKALRDELQRSKDYVETIMDNIEDQILVIDREYRIIRANKVALMNSRGPVVGEHCHTVSHDLNRPCWTEGYECPAQNVFITGRNFRTTHQHRGIAGDMRFHEVVGSPIKDASGSVLHVIEVIRDVTDRIRHEEEIFNKNRELVALNSVAGILSKSLRPEEIFEQVLDKLIEMMRMDGGGIFFLDPSRKEMHCQCHKGISDEFVRLMSRIRLGEDVPGKVAVTGQGITTFDISKDQRIERSILKHSGIKAYCSMPIRGKETVIGVFSLFSFRTHLFTVEEENILRTIGEMTGIALENIKLYEAMRELYEYQRKRREDEHVQMLSLSTRLGSAVELRDVMGGVLDHIKNIVHADFAWLLVGDAEGNLRLKSSSSSSAVEGARRVVFEKGISSLEGYTLERRSPQVFSDIRAGSKFFLPPEIDRHDFQSAISVPMHLGEKTIGVFTLYYLGARDFKEEELHFLRIIANILSVSIERSDYYHRALREKTLADTILESVSDAIITVDTSGKTLSVNRALERLTGVTSSEAVGQPACDLLRFADENIDFRLALGECLEGALTGNMTTRESFLITSSGSRVAMRIDGTPVLNEEKRVTGVVNLLRDISREQEIDRMKTEIIRSVSHDFRTPLSAIVGMTEMILEGDVEGSTVRTYLETILNEGMRLSHLVSDLLSIARIESGRESLNLGQLDTDALLGSIAAFFAGRILKKNATLRYDGGGIKSFVGDEEKIKQLLINLVDNALMFSDEGCIIEIRAIAKEKGVEISVSDTGWGIPEHDIPHLKERFYRGKHGEKMKGTGLGLYLCNEIMKMHGGTMDIRSRLSGGTDVVLSFPERGEP